MSQPDPFACLDDLAIPPHLSPRRADAIIKACRDHLARHYRCPACGERARLRVAASDPQVTVVPQTASLVLHNPPPVACPCGWSGLLTDLAPLEG